MRRAITLMLVASLVGCGVSGGAPAAPDAGFDLAPDTRVDDVAPGLRVEIAAPATTFVGAEVPLVVRVIADSTLEAESLSGWVDLEVAGGSASPAALMLHRGQGTLTTELVGEGVTTLGIVGFEGLTAVRIVEPAAPRQLAGELAGDDLVWGPGEVIEVRDDASVAAGTTLRIEAGTRVRLAAHANLTINGDVVCDGTETRPVVFEPAGRDEAWGGLTHRGSATYRWTFVVGGGGDVSRAFGHSGSQPVLFAEPASVVTLDHVAIQDCPGKALGGTGAELRIDDSWIARTDTGGELVATHLQMTGTWLADFPDVGAPPADDDNDALYLKDAKLDEGSPIVSRIEACTFVGGLDDGIDHNGATVEIERVWISDFAHEGIAASTGGKVWVRDTAISRCQQGLEAGYGAPRVSAEHVLLFGNEVGARYGDSYDWEVQGTLSLTNSVIVNNTGSGIRNYVNLMDGPVPGALNVTYSLTDDTVMPGAGNLHGEASLDAFLRLEEGSLGSGAASDGGDMGLLHGQSR